MAWDLGHQVVLIKASGFHGCLRCGAEIGDGSGGLEGPCPNQWPEGGDQ